jgi:hypothetical protein
VAIAQVCAWGKGLKNGIDGRFSHA